MEAVLEAFAAERLLTLAAGTVELSHEALLTAWPLLRDTWLADTHADRIVRTRLRATADEWERQSRDPSYLYSPLQRQPAAGSHRHRHPDRRRSRPAPAAQSDRAWLPARQQPRSPANHPPAAGRDRRPARPHPNRPHHRRNRRPQCRQYQPPARHRPVPPARRRKPEHRRHPSRDRASARRRRLGRLPHQPGRLGHHDPAGRAPATRHAARRPVHRLRGGVQPRRQAARQRRQRRHRAAVGSRHPPGRRRAAPCQCPQWRIRGGVQPRRQAAGQRSLRRHRVAVASIALRASLCGAVRRRGTTDTTKNGTHYATGEPQPKVCG